MSGNLSGISVLVKGMEVQEAIKKLKGISCGNKSTSCPDQLALALEELVAKFLIKSLSMSLKCHYSIDIILCRQYSYIICIFFYFSKLINGFEYFELFFSYLPPCIKNPTLIINLLLAIA